MKVQFLTDNLYLFYKHFFTNYKLVHVENQHVNRCMRSVKIY